MITSSLVPKLLGVSVEEEWNGNEHDVFSIVGDKKGLTKSDELRCSVYGSEFTYTIKEDSKSAYESKFVMGDLTVSYKRDKRDGDFKISIGDICKVTGVLTYSKNELYLEVENITWATDLEEDGMVAEMGLGRIEGSLTILREDDMPDRNVAYTELLTMTAAKWRALCDKLYYDIVDVFLEAFDY